MNFRTSVLAIASGLVLSMAGCGDGNITEDNHLHRRGDEFGDIDFSGYVIDGVTGRLVTTYELELIYGRTERRAKVDRDSSRFSVEGLPEAQDYSIRITADGYRPFESNNEAYDFNWEDAPFADGRRGFIFVAYLYPTSLQAPETTVRVALNDSSAPVNGTLRLRPTAVNSVLEANTPGVEGTSQIWDNDFDLLNATQTVEITGGIATIPAGTLVYGVEYDLAIFGVPGYQIANPTSLVAGNDVDRSVALAPNAGSEALAVLYKTSNILVAQPGGSTPVTLTFVFNYPIEFAPNVADGVMLNAFDGASSFNFNDTDMDATLPTPRAVVNNTAAERGFSFAISGNTLTMSGTRNAYVLTDDTGDLVNGVTFAGFDTILVRRVGTTLAADSKTLTSLNGGNNFQSVTVSVE